MNRTYCLLLALSLLLAACSQTAPQLTDLRVGGTLTGLYPPFSPDVERYYAILREEGGPVEIGATWHEGHARLRFRDELVASGETLRLDEPSPGDTLVLELVSGGAVHGAFEVLLLPSDFPRLEVLTHTPAVAAGHVYLTLNVSPELAYKVIVDNYGVPVWFEKGHAYDLKRHPDGRLSYAYLTEDVNQYGREVAEIAMLGEDFEQVGPYRTVNLSHTDPHDFLLLENDHKVFLAYAGAHRDLTAYGRGVHELVEDTVVQEVDGEGNVVFQWSSWGDIDYGDVLRRDQSDPKYDMWQQDYAHGNAVFLEPDGQGYLVSLRGTSQVVKIDRESGNLVWTLGGVSSDFTFTNPEDVFCGQHTPSRLSNGNLLVFDNGQFCPPDGADRGTTRVAEYRLDEEAMIAELVWSYTQPSVYSLAQGSAQRLGNGNTLVGWGVGGRDPFRGPDVTVTEVDQQGDKVWELGATFRVPVEAGSGDTEVQERPANSYRAWRFPLDATALSETN